MVRGKGANRLIAQSIDLDFDFIHRFTLHGRKRPIALRSRESEPADILEDHVDQIEDCGLS